MPRLSVLMPAHNAADTIGIAVRTTLRALPFSSELVVLDDGSSDATAQVLDQIADRRLRVLHRENHGVAAALTDLLAATDSELVARMDADDLCLPQRFHRQLAAMADVDVAFATVRPWTGSARPAAPRPWPLTPAEFPFHLLLSNPVAHPTMLARRSAIDAVGGYRDVPSEDLDLWLRLSTNGFRLRRIALPGIGYRSHPAQITADAEWRLRSWRDPRTNEAYSALARRMIGQPAMRITSLSVADLPAVEKLRRFDAFAEAFRTASVALPPLARRRAVRRLAQRERWLRGAVEIAQTTAPAGEVGAIGRS